MTTRAPGVLAIALIALLCGGCRRAAPPAQAPDPELDHARKVYFEEGARPALPLFQQILARYEAAGNARGAAIVVGLIGNCYKRLGDLQKADELLQQALSRKRTLGDRPEEARTLGHLGLLAWERGGYPEAIAYQNQALAIALELQDRELEGATLNNLGLVYHEQGDYGRAADHFERAIAVHRARGFTRGESDAIGNLAGVQLALGRYREALDQYRAALAISERLQSKVQQSQDLGNIAHSQLRLGETDAALASYDRALALARDAGLAKEEADWRKGRGSALLQLGRHDEAAASYQQAMAVYEKAGLKRELVEALLDIGQAQADVGDAADAGRSFARAAALAESIGHAAGVTGAALAHGDLERRRRQFAAARTQYLRARTLATRDGDLAALADAAVHLSAIAAEEGDADAAAREAAAALESAKKSGARAAEAAAHRALGEAERVRRRWAAALEHYREADALAAMTGDAELRWRVPYDSGRAREAAQDLEGALADLRRAVNVIEEVRTRLSAQRSRSGYLADKHQVYAALVRVLLALNRPGDAFAFAERLRAQSYFESIAAGPVRAGDPSARRAEAELGARIRHLQQALQEERNRPGDQRRGEALIAYSTELDAAERAYGAFLDSLRQSDPRQAAARALETPTVALVQQRLPAGAALVEYVSGDDGLAVFVVTRSALQARMLPVTHADLVSRVELLRDLLARPGSDRWRQPAAGLYERLIAPIRAAGWLDGVSQLIVAPHGVLHYVPFAALVAGPPAARFLVEDFALTLVPAAAALADSRPRAAAPGSILAAAPARSRLRFAAAEARGVAASAGEDGVALIGTAATESAFKQQAARYRIVHLATHGRFNRVNPLLSGIELEADAGNDGDLQVFEILGLSLDAELVTLSACETALGAGLAADVPPGEEFVGLTRAFLTAGSRAVLASLWDIDDRATTAFMTGYYGRARQQPFAVALAGAQRAAIAGGGADSHPARWASFVIVGGL